MKWRLWSNVIGPLEAKQGNSGSQAATMLPLPYCVLRLECDLRPSPGNAGTLAQCWLSIKGRMQMVPVSASYHQNLTIEVKKKVF